MVAKVLFTYDVLESFLEFAGIPGPVAFLASEARDQLFSPPQFVAAVCDLLRARDDQGTGFLHSSPLLLPSEVTSPRNLLPSTPVHATNPKCL